MCNAYVLCYTHTEYYRPKVNSSIYSYVLKCTVKFGKWGKGGKLPLNKCTCCCDFLLNVVLFPFARLFNRILRCHFCRIKTVIILNRNCRNYMHTYMLAPRTAQKGELQRDRETETLSATDSTKWTIASRSGKRQKNGLLMNPVHNFIPGVYTAY